MATLEKRFAAKYIPEPNTGCWLWTSTIRVDGYGSIRKGSSYVSAHRVSWLLHYGDIPDLLCVLHKCDTRACVNPAHLFLGTRKDNVVDMIKKGRGSNQQKTHCKNGHALCDDNLYIHATSPSRPRGYRKCKTCNYKWGKEANARRREVCLPQLQNS